MNGDFENAGNLGLAVSLAFSLGGMTILSVIALGQLVLSQVPFLKKSFL